MKPCSGLFTKTIHTARFSMERAGTGLGTRWKDGNGPARHPEKFLFLRFGLAITHQGQLLAFASEPLRGDYREHFILRAQRG